MSKYINKNNIFFLLFFLATATFLVNCQAGHEQYTSTQPANFWDGLWHGMISWLMLVVGLFSENVFVYEINNNGGWYDFGFLLGIGMIWGGAWSGGSKWKGSKDCGWDKFDKEFEVNFEKRFYEKCRQWADEEDAKEWEDIADKVKEKLKREIKNWAEKE